MDIAALSIGYSNAKVQQQASLSVMKMAMDLSKNNADSIKEIAGTSMERSVNQHLGGKFDMKL